MNGRLGMRAAATIAIWCCGSLAALGQNTEERKPQREPGGGGYNAVIDNIDMLIDNYTRFLGRKYDLNGDQDEFTKKLMRDKCYGFLDKHEGELRDLFDKMFEARTGGQMTQDDLMSWGKRCLPVFEEAKKIVVSGNTEWREILNDQQKTIHDGDLKLMDESLKSTEETLTRIVGGEMTVDEFVHPTHTPGAGKRRPPNPAVAEAQNQSPGDSPPPGEAPVAVEMVDGRPVTQAIAPPGAVRVKPANRRLPENASNGAEGGAAVGGKPEPLPVDPAGNVPPPPPNPNGEVPESGEVQPPPQPEQPQPEQPPQEQPQPPNTPAAKSNAPKPPGKNYETEWEKYVREFIDKYKLDATQTQQAEQFLKDSEAQADKYLSGKKSELDTIEKREGELKGSGAKGPKVSNDAAKPAEPVKGADASKTSELAELTKKRESLMAPIGKMFEEGLKPKLEKLPTRAQRKAAEEAAKKPAAKTARPGDAKPGAKPATPAGKGAEGSAGGKDKKP